MLETKVASLSPEELSFGLDRLIFVAKLIKANDDPYIKEEEAAMFDLVSYSYKRLEPNHEIRRKYPSFKVYKAYNIVQHQFTRQQIDETSYTLMDMYRLYESLKEGGKPELTVEMMYEFKNALNRLRSLIESGKMEKKYTVMLPRLEVAHAKLEIYFRPSLSRREAIPSGL